jgi:2-polyprenyl-3-methyl-5-hydroxy-6-metoxy-1,4-benzoquinol methylase
MDIFGQALLDFDQKGAGETLWIHNSYDEPEEMPIDIFFRDEEEIPDLEHKALSLCKGRILDVGAGVGSHALILQDKGFDVTAIDISAGAVKLMKQRGVKKALQQDFFTMAEKFDTLLFLMNGIGITGTLAGFSAFLAQAKTRIHPLGQLLFDSSDINYLYQALKKPENKYFGEVSYQYEYQQQKGSWFNWVYIDQKTVKLLANQHGWKCEIVFDDGEDQYLARLTMN